MKHFSIILILLVFTTSCNNSDTATEKKTSDQEENSQVEKNNESNDDKDYTDSAFPSESGMVKFKHEGAVAGTEVWYWDEWGDKQRKERVTTIEMMGFKKEDNNITVILDDKVYGLNVDKKTATLIQVDLAGELSDLQYNDEEIMTQMGGKKLGTEEILGKTCDVWELSNFMARVSAWRGLALHSIVDVMGMKNEITATELDIKYSPASSMFDISDYEIKDMGSIEDIMKGI